MNNASHIGHTGLTARQMVTTVVLCLLFLLLEQVMVGVNAMHLLCVVAFAALFLSHPTTRRLAIALLPFIVFAVTYDWMRLYPNYMVNPIDTRDIHDAELSLFGIIDEGATVTPNEFFNRHHAPAADLLAGFFYLCWVPVPILFGLWLWLKRDCKTYVHFSLVFLFVNWLGFCGYYLHPTAPPWYVMQFGFEPILSTPGNTAGLARFDELVGIPVFTTIYGGNANIFAAVPSLHAAYMLIATVYAAISRQKWTMTAVFAFITVGIWWTAVYSGHHYIIDVLLGILTAFIGILLFEKALMRIPLFHKFIDRFADSI